VLQKPFKAKAQEWKEGCNRTHCKSKYETPDVKM